MGRRKGPGLTREQVIDAALVVVSTEGADALGVSKVARVLGIRPPSVYNHVGPGDALGIAVVLRGYRLFFEALEQAVRGVEPAEDQLHALAMAARRWALTNQGLYTLMSRIEPQIDDPAYLPVMRDTLDLFAQPFARLGVPQEQRIHAIRGLRAAIHGFVHLETLHQFQLEEDPEASYRWLVRCVVRGASAP